MFKVKSYILLNWELSSAWTYHNIVLHFLSWFFFLHFPQKCTRKFVYQNIFLLPSLWRSVDFIMYLSRELIFKKKTKTAVYKLQASKTLLWIYLHHNRSKPNIRKSMMYILKEPKQLKSYKDLESIWQNLSKVNFAWGSRTL